MKCLTYWLKQRKTEEVEVMRVSERDGVCVCVCVGERERMGVRVCLGVTD